MNEKSADFKQYTVIMYKEALGKVCVPWIVVPRVEESHQTLETCRFSLIELFYAYRLCADSKCHVTVERWNTR